MKRKFLLSSAAVLLAAVSLCACGDEVVSSVTLDGTALKDTVSATGYIQSTDEKSVCSSLGYSIKEVDVEVGDTVKKGDVLCVLDSSALETAIVSARTALNSGKTNSGYSLSQTEKDYIKMRDELAAGTYQPIVLAERNVDYTKEALTIAEKNYNDKVKELSDGSDIAIKAKQTALQLAQSNVDISYDTFKKTLLTSGFTTTALPKRICAAFFPLTEFPTRSCDLRLIPSEISATIPK